MVKKYVVPPQNARAPAGAPRPAGRRFFLRPFFLLEIEGKESSPRELAARIDLAKRKSIRTIFIRPQCSRKTADVIA